MFKRANKITALLVAAASVMSVVPAMAADYTKVDSQDGTVYNAVAYKDGTSYIDAGIDGKDDATYYLADGKFNNLSDIDSGSDVEIYGTKYVDAGSGDYFIDLENGTVTDEDVKSNEEDDAASALRKKVKNDTDGRYVEDSNAGGSEYIFDLSVSGAKLPSAEFADAWYGVQYRAKNTANGGASTLNVYTDAKGNYIDADYNLGKIKVTTTASGSTSKTVTIENTNDTYEADGTTSFLGADKLSASVASATVIGQDADYIYRTADVTVKAANGATITKIDGLDIAGTSAFTTTHNALGTANTTTFTVIQKISKAQASGDVDGAKYAKTVTSYVLSNDSAATETLLANSTIVNGKIVTYGMSGNQIQTQTATLKSSNGYYYADLADLDNGEDVESNNTDAGYAYNVDAEGNLWRLDGGYIYQWDNDADWNKVYKVDGSFNKISVYDKDNMVAWNQDDEVYSVIGAKTTDTTTEPTTPVVTAGWAQAANGAWTYNKADGTKATGWLLDGATWYYLKADGVMAKGWVQDGATWYYTNASGAMQTGWINDNGTWYYTNASGVMLANTTVDGYVLGASGAWVK